VFDEKFLNAVRDRKIYHFKLDFPVSLTWDECFDLINRVDINDKKHIVMNERGRFNFLSILQLGTFVPKNVRQIEQHLKDTFYKNVISCQIFAGIHKQSGSFPIHKDVMDVCYIQVKNDITLKIFKDPESRSIFSKKFQPGDGIWIPRGTYHQIVTDKPRIGYSFGVEGPADKKIRDQGVDLDPSTYI
jgi:hypothetical protein